MNILLKGVSKGLEYPNNTVQFPALSSSLLRCLPPAQNLREISPEFTIAAKPIGKTPRLRSAAPYALLSTWKTRKQRLTLK